VNDSAFNQLVTGNTALVWRPPSDNELTWFRADYGFPEFPRPLDYSLGVQALCFGLTQALVSLYFPLYEFRSRLVEGRLYLAVVPLEMAERNLSQRLGQLHDSALRFTRSIKRSWDRALGQQAESYNEWMARVDWSRSPATEVAERLHELRRVRANQWYDVVRGVIAPTAMLQQQQGTADNDERVRESESVLREAHECLRRGEALLLSAVDQIGSRLERARCLDQEDDVYWLEWKEVRAALVQPSDLRNLVEDRQDVARQARSRSGPATLGPELPPDAPRMYLVREVLALLP
jgi:hypothetical protein